VYKKKPVAKRPATKPKASLQVVRQQNLGQQTESRQIIKPLFSDPRAKVVKSIMLPSFLEQAVSARIDATLSGLSTWGIAALASQKTLALISDTLQGNLNNAGNPGISRYLLESASTDCVFSNLSTAPCTLNIYTCTAKRDTWFPPTSSTDQMNFTNSSGTKYYWDGGPYTAVREGLNAAAGYVNGAVLAIENPSSVPSQSKLFRDYFKITKTQRVFMAQGGNHTFRLSRQYDRFVDGSVIKNNALQAVGGITDFIMYSVVGAPGTQADSTITTTLGHIGIVQTTKYRFSAALSNQSNLYEANFLGQTSPIDIVNPGSGGTGVAVSN